MLKIADIVGTIKPTGVFVKSTGGYVKNKVQQVIEFFIGIVVVVSIFSIIYYGLLFVTASGDTNKVQKATQGIIYSVIGIIIAFVAGVVVNFVVNFLKGTP